MTAAETAAETAAAPAATAEEPRHAAVRRLLLARLDEAGLTRPRGMTAEAFAAQRQRLVETLDYLPDPALEALAASVLRLASGPLLNHWPAEATVRNLAANLLPPPPEREPIITSWLASVEGPIARDGGFLTELYLRLCRRPLPPSRVLDYPWLAEQAEENRRTRARLRGLTAAGIATEADRAWLEDYARAEARALAIVETGEVRRAGKASQ